MLDEIQIFRTEIDSIIADIAQLRGKTLSDRAVEDRIRQCFITWSRLKSPIESSGVPSLKVMRIDGLLETAARDAGRRIGRGKFRTQLREANKSLANVYLDVARTQPSSRPQRILEEIPNLPDEFIPKSP